MVSSSNDEQKKSVNLFDHEIDKEKEFPMNMKCTECKWFDYDSIAQIEKDYFPEFSSTAKTKNWENYKKVRNIIYNMYCYDQNTYLTVTACRRLISFDLSIIMRMHSFLEFHSIINFGLKNNSSIKKEVNKKKLLLQSNNNRAKMKNMIDVLEKYKLFLETDSKADKEKQFGEILEMFTSDEQQCENVVWNEEELYKLTEAVMSNGNNWDKVAHDVGTTKTPTQCLFKYILMDYENQYNLKKPNSLDFLDNDANSLTNLIGALASTVEPSVMKAAFEAAIEKQSNIKQQRKRSTLDSISHDKYNENFYQDILKAIVSGSISAFISNTNLKENNQFEKSENLFSPSLNQLLYSQLMQLNTKIKDLEKKEHSLQQERELVNSFRQSLLEKEMKLKTDKSFLLDQLKKFKHSETICDLKLLDMIENFIEVNFKLESTDLTLDAQLNLEATKTSDNDPNFLKKDLTYNSTIQNPSLNSSEMNNDHSKAVNPFGAVSKLLLDAVKNPLKDLFNSTDKHSKSNP